jgi:ubiquinone/menaquinone biosynthesis C-methylase UbiE
MNSYLHRVAKQFRRPQGLLGTFVAGMMRKYNNAATLWTVECLQLQATDSVLEIGFGPGTGIRQVLTVVSSGKVCGIDLSPSMVRMATKANAVAVENGKVELKHGDACALPYKDFTFDKVFAVNVIYFWNDPAVPLSEIWRTMKMGGQCALFILEKGDLLQLKWAQTDVFKKYENEDVLELMKHAGFKDCRIETKKLDKATGVCILGNK